MAERDAASCGFARCKQSLGRRPATPPFRYYGRNLRTQQCETCEHRPFAPLKGFAKAGSDANKPPRWSAERRASPGAQTVKASLRGDARAC